MLELIGQVSRRATAHVLCVGAHCDDIEIGCGGTLQVLQASRPKLQIHWVIASSTPQRSAETGRAMSMLVKRAQRGQLHFGAFPDGQFPAHYAALKAFFESLKKLPRPDLILCHERDDRHQDHRIVNEMVWNTFRDHAVLEYEVPKWDGGLGQPNLYVPLTGAQLQAKIDALMQAYASQQRRDWFTPGTFEALARLRGIECRAGDGFAEAFHARKLRFAGL
jgi:LmbE family N-acetylglucosaminyl deacetylase